MHYVSCDFLFIIHNKKSHRRKEIIFMIFEGAKGGSELLGFHFDLTVGFSILENHGNYLFLFLTLFQFLF